MCDPALQICARATLFLCAVAPTATACSTPSPSLCGRRTTSGYIAMYGITVTSARVTLDVQAESCIRAAALSRVRLLECSKHCTPGVVLLHASVLALKCFCVSFVDAGITRYSAFGHVDAFGRKGVPVKLDVSEASKDNEFSDQVRRRSCWHSNVFRLFCNTFPVPHFRIGQCHPPTNHCVCPASPWGIGGKYARQFRRHLFALVLPLRRCRPHACFHRLPRRRWRRLQFALCAPCLPERQYCPAAHQAAGHELISFNFM